VPGIIGLLVTMAAPAFIDDPFGFTFFLSLPFSYLIFVIIEIAISYRFTKIAMSSRNKTAAECFLYSVSYIGLFIIPVTMVMIWKTFYA